MGYHGMLAELIRYVMMRKHQMRNDAKQMEANRYDGDTNQHKILHSQGRWIVGTLYTPMRLTFTALIQCPSPGTMGQIPVCKHYWWGKRALYRMQIFSSNQLLDTSYPTLYLYLPLPSVFAASPVLPVVSYFSTANRYTRQMVIIRRANKRKPSPGPESNRRSAKVDSEEIYPGVPWEVVGSTNHNKHVKESTFR
ncbi:unnamed protein product [Acanthoscelides obtectus]|uniref:Uncharacterized protein n=1 Tax=Acanthoscelides obtectus TaxID=200917 RepID=A0A9P0PKL1_ACAOB|nr:unnamed protein product [Acanthoscelides obtectus]CAK1641513.1 hypothetical protein AOBTE_LOCUS12454 [Acanthoscelides obtectus]